MGWFFSKPKPAASTGRVLNALDLLNAGATTPAGDVGYAEVNSAWLASYYDSFRNSLFREGVVKWDSKFDCNHFADAYAVLAQLKFVAENFQSRTSAQTLAIGVAWYRRDVDGGGHAIASAEKLDGFGHDLHFGAFLAGFLVVPGVELEASFHKERLPLFAVFADDLSHAPVGFEVHEGHFLAFLSALRGEIAVHGERETGNGGAFRRVLDFRVTSEVPDEHDFV